MKLVVSPPAGGGDGGRDRETGRVGRSVLQVVWCVVVAVWQCSAGALAAAAAAAAVTIMHLLVFSQSVLPQHQHSALTQNIIFSLESGCLCLHSSYES